jgi:hypothetical protein
VSPDQPKSTFTFALLRGAVVKVPRVLFWRPPLPRVNRYQ